MKGVINEGIQELIQTKFGAEAWEKVKELAHCEEPFFSASEVYPDQMTLDLANAACEVSGLPLETLLVEFGKLWLPNTAARAYPTFFGLAGKTPREFLRNMDRVHQQVTRTMLDARPPRFGYEDLPDGRLLMHYHSERKLCAVMRGLVLGVGVYFDEELQVQETACASNGNPHCTMEITFP